MISPKFKVGQKVYGQSDWFAGSYIPDCYIIRKNEISILNGEEVVLCYVKQRKTPMLESMLFATEEEAQLREVDRFKDKTMKNIAMLREQLKNVGITHEAIALIGESDPLNTSHKYRVGDVVYGHMDGYGYVYKPERFVITGMDSEWYDRKEHNVYKVKGHGSRSAYEEYLYPTYKEALLADLIRFKATLKGEMKSIEARSTALGIEAEVVTRLQNLKSVKYLE